MRAFIKMSKWIGFLETHTSYGFMTEKNPRTKETFYARLAVKGKVKSPFDEVFLVVTMDREVHLITPMGESPFMETQEDCFKDLIRDDLIEYVKGDFD